MSIENDDLGRGNQGMHLKWGADQYSERVSFLPGSETVSRHNEIQWDEEPAHIRPADAGEFSNTRIRFGTNTFVVSSDNHRSITQMLMEADLLAEQADDLEKMMKDLEPSPALVQDAFKLITKTAGLEGDEEGEGDGGGDGEDAFFEKIAPVAKRAVQRVPGSGTHFVLRHLGLKKHMMRELDGAWGDALVEYYKVLAALDKPGNKSLERAMRINIPLNMVRTVFGSVVTWFLREILGQYKGTK